MSYGLIASRVGQGMQANAQSLGVWFRNDVRAQPPVQGCTYYYALPHGSQAISQTYRAHVRSPEHDSSG
jgi:hypothetical protein